MGKRIATRPQGGLRVAALKPIGKITLMIGPEAAWHLMRDLQTIAAGFVELQLGPRSLAPKPRRSPP